MLLSGVMYAAQKQVVAFDKRAVADSLTAFAKRQATVGKIKVTTVRVKDDNIVEVFASRQFSTVPFSEADVQYLYETVSQIVLGRKDGMVSIYCDDKKHEVSRLISSFRRTTKLPADDIQRVPYKLKKGQPLTQNTSVPYSITSGLQGEHIALWGSHGIYFNQKEDRWLWQRAKLLTTVEDLYTTSYTMPFLVPMLENAGAVVLQPRERDTQLNETTPSRMGLTFALKRARLPTLPHCPKRASMPCISVTKPSRVRPIKRSTPFVTVAWRRPTWSTSKWAEACGCTWARLISQPTRRRTSFV